MRIRTMREITDASVTEITKEFQRGTVSDIALEDDIFAGLPDEVPEPTNEDRDHIAKYFGRLGPNRFVGY